MLKALFLAGADTFRLNFSHGTHEDHARVHAAIRALEKENAELRRVNAILRTASAFFAAEPGRR